LGGERKNTSLYKQTPAYSVVRLGTGFYGQMKLKEELVGSKPTR